MDECGALQPEQSRFNVAGLTVEVVRRDPATGAWADHRGLLDFNLLLADWPDALPAADGGFPRCAGGSRGRGSWRGSAGRAAPLQ